MYIIKEHEKQLTTRGLSMNYTLDYEMDSYNDNIGESHLVQWCTIKIDGKEVGSIQPDCGYFAEFTDLKISLSDEEQHEILKKATAIFDLEKQKWEQQERIQAIEDCCDYEEIKEKAIKIAEILQTEYTDDHLIISNVFYTAKNIDILHAMVNLQITLKCSQAQSNDIVKLFL
jgi:hypothetical protein